MCVRGSPIVPLVGNILPFVPIKLPMVPLVNRQASLVQMAKNVNTICANGTNVTN